MFLKELDEWQKNSSSFPLIFLQNVIKRIEEFFEPVKVKKILILHQLH